MKALEIISKLREFGVLPKLENDTLKLVGNTKTLPKDFLLELKEHKETLIEFLTEREEGKNEAIKPIQKRTSYPATHGQQRIWIISQFDGGTEAYNITGIFYLKGTVNVDILEKSFKNSINKHENLRTIFEMAEGTLVQKVKDEIAFSIEESDIQGEDGQIEKIKEIDKQFRQAPFELSQAPLFRVKLTTIAKDEKVMFFSMHHIIGDGWSLGVLVKEVMANYELLCLSQPLEKNEGRIQFKDYAEWLKTKINGRYGETARQFWSEKSLDKIEPINLPIDFERKGISSFEGATLKYYFEDDFQKEIEGLAKRNQTTVFNVFRSVISLAFHKWTNQTKLVVGTPIAGRSNYQLSDQIGLFINTLPLVSEFRESTSFEEYLKDVTADSMAVFKYQDYPLDLILEENGVQKDPARNPLFDVMMVVQNTALGDGTIDLKNQHGFTLNPIKEYYQEENLLEVDDVFSKFDMSFNFAVETGGTHFLELEYKTKLFKKETVSEFYQFFKRILEQVIIDDQIQIGAIEVISSKEKEQVLNELNSPISKPSEEHLTELILPALKTYASRTALKDSKNSYSYSELDQISERIAYHVSQFAHEGIGLFLTRSIHVVSTVLGVWKTGKYYVPIDTKYPEGRIEYIISDSNLEVLLVDDQSLKNVPESFKGEILNITEFKKSGGQFSMPAANNNDTAYLIYTSGSTGQPKGVQITHLNAITFLKWASLEFENTPYDVMFAGTSYCFDLSIFEMLLPLYQGKTIRVLDSGLEISEYLKSDKRIFINTVPSVIRSLIDLEVDWSNVNAINMAGEAVPKIFKDILDYKRIEVRNLYGPSEDTTYSTCYRFEEDDLPYIPIGNPVGDTHLYIVDEALNLLPIGIEGEIVLSGSSVAKGYFGKVELTEKCFVENPYVHGERLYRTGDIGKWTKDGHVAFVGRKDEQVKVRGFRIELGEIQYQLDSIPEIVQAFVVVLEVYGEKQIVAYYQGEQGIDEEDIRNFLVKQLPLYMIPSTFVKVDKFPTNANGKIDKSKLPSPSAENTPQLVEPKTETEAGLLKIWKEVLGTDNIGVVSNFFEHGGHSLKATRLKNEIEKVFQKEVTLNELFLYPEVGLQAKIIDEKPLKESDKIPSVRATVDGTGEYQVSFAQERLWVLTKFEEVSKAYHMPAAFEVEGELDIDKLQLALKMVVEKHEILRTTFIEKDGIPIQVVHPLTEKTFGIERVELDAQDDIKSFLRTSWVKSFDLEKGPLFRCQFIRQNESTYLTVDMHHIISDGWSIGVLFKDWIKSYKAILDGGKGALSSLNIQYKDFSHWQRDILSPEKLEEQLAYWRDTVFKDGVTPIDLPYDYLRPTIKTYSGSSFSKFLPVELYSGLKSQANQSGASLFMVLMGNVSILLSKLSNQMDITVGTPVAGRNNAQLEDQIGFYINTLPIRSTISGEQSIGELFHTQRKNLLTAFNYQHFPFEKLIEEVQPKRDLSRSPLFDVMVLFQNFEILDEENVEVSDEVAFKRLDTTAGFTKYDLTFSFAVIEGKLELTIEYNVDLFKLESIQRMTEQFELLLKQTTVDLGTKINTLSILTDHERNLLCPQEETSNALNGTINSHEENNLLHLLNDNFVALPDQVAVKDDNTEWTYGELNEFSTNLAKHLTSVETDGVGLFLSRSVSVLGAVLGVWKANKFYIPIDVSYPIDRVNYLLEDSEAHVLLVDNQSVQDVPDTYKGQIINLNELADLSDVKAPTLSEDRGQLAYFIYTSGSTGLPKGVQITHQNVIAFLKWSLNEFAKTPYQTMLAGTSYCFDLSIFEMLLPLAQGKLIQIISSGMDIPDALEKGEGYFINTVPSVVRSLIDLEVSWDNVVAINMAGEPIPRVFKDLLDYKSMEIRNLYGPSEDTTYSTCYRFEDDELHYIPIGKPVDDTQVYILDEAQHLQPIGVPGEICLTGASISKGYYGKPELTELCFSENPFLEGERLYRTGDIGKWTSDNQLMFIGRKDDQVKVRGYRIELGEIQYRLDEINHLEQAFVQVLEINGEKSIVAYYQRKLDISIEEIKKMLGTSIPAYMIPYHFIELESFPLNSNGKIDKSKLPDVQNLGAVEFVSPRDKMESEIAEIWKEVLNIESVGIHDDFFGLGGHSLKATRLISHYERAFGVRLEMKTLFLETTLEGHRNAISSSTKDRFEVIPKIKEERLNVLSDAQRRIWVLCQFEGMSVAYNISTSVKLNGDYQVSYFQQAFDLLIEKHESLRTVFEEGEKGSVFQRIKEASDFQFTVEYEDLSQNPSKGEHLKLKMEQDAATPFDLKNGPLFRAKLYRLSDGEYEFYLNMHHIISDGWSLSILSKEVLENYALLEAGEKPVIKPLRIQYKDYAAWQVEQLESDNYKKQANYWLNQLSGELPVLELPTSKTRPIHKTNSGRQLECFYSQNSLTNIKEYSRSKGGSLFMGLNAVLNVLLHQYSRQEELLIGTPVSGRNHIDLEDQIGMYINTIVMRTSISAKDNFDEIYKGVQEVCMDGFENQMYPFDRLVEQLRLKRDTSRNAVFDVLMILQNNEAIAIQSEEEIVVNTPIECGPVSSKLDIEFSFKETSGFLSLTVTFNPDIYDQELIEQLMMHYGTLLDICVSAPSEPIALLDYLTDQEKRELVSLNPPRKEEPIETILAAIAEQVRTKPDQQAIVFEDKTLTYSELDEISTRFASFLKNKCGVEQGEFVGLRIDRSEWLVIAILAIMKAGGVYVPIDINHPTDRIKFIEKQCDIKTTISDDLISSFSEEREMGEFSQPRIVKDDLAYVIFTSGSTGVPKGVMVTHGNLASFTHNFAETFSFNRVTKFAATTSFTFDISVIELLGVLSQGITIDLFASTTLAEPELIVSRIISEGIDGLQVTPSRCSQLILVSDNFSEKLQLLLVGGEAVSSDLFKALQGFTPRVVQVYGPTETTIWSTSMEILPDESLHIGQPLYNESIFILNDQLQLVPKGVVGEICIGGNGVSTGYVKQDELTEKFFVSNPFETEGRLYRSGDLGKWNSDGQLIFLGRKDHQVKIRGYRVELQEVANVLLQKEGIQESVVVAKSLQKHAEKELIAYFVSSEEEEIKALKDHLSSKLPAYMVPSYFMQLHKLPLNRSGKIDRKALPEPTVELASAADHVPPTSELEKQIAEQWQENLGIESISVNDNFFDLGGHSLSATRLKSALESTLNKSISLTEIFQFPTIKAQAALLTEKINVSTQPIRKIEENTDGLYELSFAQERLWVLTQFEEASHAYNMPVIFEVKGELDHELFEQALMNVVARHESLRTVFTEVDGKPYQCVKPIESINAELGLHKLNYGLDLHPYLADLWGKVFDLENGPLFRCDFLQHESRKYLSFNMHHIVSDGWSLHVIFRDVMSSYSKLVRGENGELEDLEIQYKDFANWQKEELSEENLANQLAYWRNEVFADGISAIELPYDYLRPEVKTYNGSSITGSFSESLSSELKLLAKQNRASLFMALMANMNVLLKKLSNQSNIVIGTPISGRDVNELEDQIGFFINTLPINTHVSGEMSFNELLLNQKTNVINAFEHQHFPFELLVDELQTTRDLSRSPLFDVMVALQNFDHIEHSESEHIGFEMLGVPSPSTKYDLTFSFADSDSGISFEIEYNTDLFLEETIQRMVKQLRRVVVQTTANQLVKIKDVSVLSSEELNQLVKKGDQTAVTYSKQETIVSRFAEMVKKHPDKAALKVEGTILTYRELDQESGRLASTLVEKYGVKNGDFVILHVGRSKWMMVSILATLKAGGVYVPIDPDYPKSRVEYILQDSGAKLILADEINENLEGLVDDQLIVDLNAFENTGEALEKEITSDQIAYVIYTSGTTGNPKGVLITHENVNRLLFNDADYFDFSEEDNWSLFHSYCFDFSVWEMYGAILKGGTLVMVPKEVAQDSHEFFRFLIEEEITVLNQTPTAFRSLCLTNESRFEQSELSVRYVIFGGEALSPISLKSWNQHFPQCRLINMYGITETTVHVTYKEITQKEIRENKSNIGLPIPTLSCYVLDSDLKPCAPGVIGELCVGGAGVARGYHNKPELTAEKFVDNPWDSNEKMYRSGDFARLLPNGDIEYIGRKDEQVKIRGHRIEMGEVEEGVKSIDIIRDSVVIASINELDEFDLIAYYILDIKDSNAETKIREKLKLVLPAYMIPAFLVELDSFPQTSNGKLDKGALPSPSTIEKPEQVYIEAQSELEKELMEIWREVLGRERIGVTDDFFHLGGHSLKATKIKSLISKRIGKEVKLSELFKNTTISAQVGLLTDKVVEENVLISPVEESSDGVYPVSIMQERLWVLTQFEEASRAYHMPALMEVKGTFDFSTFKLALEAVYLRHESLRTVFVEQDGVPRQRVIPAKLFEPQLAYLKLDDYAQLESTLEEWNEPFDLEKGPLFRCVVIEVDQRNIVFFNIHHMIGDGWSFGVLFNDVSKAYNALLEGDDVNEIQELTIQYKDFASWQHKQFTAEKLNDQLTYWKDEVFNDGLTTLSLPYDYDRPEIKTYNGADLNYTFSKEITDTLRRQVKEEGASVFMGLMANLKILLSKLSNEKQVIIGTPVAGRDNHQLQDQIGFFVNTIPVKSTLDSSMSFNSCLRQEKEVMLSAFEYQHFPFEMLVEALQPKRDLSRNPLFDVLIVHQNFDVVYDQSIEKDHMKLTAVEQNTKFTKFDLTFNFIETEDEIGLTLEYNTDLYSQEGAKKLIEELEQVIEQTTADDKVLLQNISILGEAEKETLLHQFNESIQPHEEGSIAEMIKGSLKDNAASTAIRFGSKEISYEVLDQRSNRVANRLVNVEKVGVFIKRSEDIMYGILGALKSGTLYVPIDVNYPKDRIRYICDDAELEVILTNHESKPFLPDELDIDTIELEDVEENELFEYGLADYRDKIAYLIYTSGSSGKPKGVSISNRNGVAFLKWCQEEFEQTKYDILYAGTSYCFDLSVFEMLLPLIQGKQIRILESALSINEYVENDQNVFINTVPSVVRSLLDLNLDWTNVTALNMAGEPVPKIFKQELDYNKMEVRNLYGPSEDTTYSTVYRFKDDGLSYIPIGQPVGNTQAYILDESQQMVPIGVEGEIVLSGESTALGYYNRPDLSSKVFIDNPFGYERKMYRTGDIGKWSKDGQLIYVGRKDDQVKIRGYRIELGEIEFQMEKIPEVQQAVVLVKGSDAERGVVVYYELSSTITEEEIKTTLARRLPSYMVPGAFMQLDKIPLNSNGKVDKKALPDLEKGAESENPYIAPSTEIQEKLVEIWQEVLGKKLIGIRDNFFQLGGHSLKATQVISLIQQEYGVKIDLKNLFIDPTIEHLSEYIDTLTWMEVNNEDAGEDDEELIL